MPLTCAAEWDATGGKKVAYDEVNRGKRAASYRRLLDLLESGKIEARGERLSRPEPIPREDFKDCAIHLPDFDDVAAWEFADRQILRSYAYETREAWREIFDDQLLRGRATLWRRIELLKADVKEHLPHRGPMYRSGAAGRPTSKHLVIPELMKRAAENRLEPKLTLQASVLVEWLFREHPDAPPLEVPGCINMIRHVYNAQIKRIKSSI